jgi:hypothetical protein
MFNVIYSIRWLPFLFLLAACSTGYKPTQSNISLGSSNAGFYLSSGKWKDTVRLDLSINFTPAKPVDLQIELKNADKDSMTYTLLKVVGPTKAPSMEGEHWIYYFYTTPGRHFSRRVRVTLCTKTIQKTFLLEIYHHVHLLS